MKYVPLGRTGVRVSALAFGTMSFGKEADEATSAALFSSCRDAGINLFDCANVYSQGRAEEILGRLVRGCRDEIVLTSKAHFPMGEGPNAGGSSRYHLVRAAEASLRRLGTEYLDVFFLHRFDEGAALDETLRAVEQLVRSGKILHPAVSNFAAWQTAKALGIQAVLGASPLVAVQPMYNLLKRQAEVEILPHAQEEGLAVLPYSPLAGGLLTGKYASEGSSRGRLDESSMYATRYGEDALRRAAIRFSELAAEVGAHPVTLAVAWVQSHPAVTAPLLGARNVAQLRPSLEAADFEIDPTLRERISSLTPEPPPATDRSEERTAQSMAFRK